MLTSFGLVVKNIQGTITLANQIASGDYSSSIIPISPKDQLGNAISLMTTNLKSLSETNQNQDWLKTGLNLLNETISEVDEIQQLSTKVFSFLIPYLDVQVGVFYIKKNTEQGDVLTLQDSYAYHFRKHSNNEFLIGEGIVGQCAKEKKSFILTQVPNDHINVTSGLGESTPKQLYLMPIIFEYELLGVIEIASLSSFSKLQIEFLEQVAPVMGTNLFRIQQMNQSKILLEEVQQTNHELEIQSSELELANHSLEERTTELELAKEDLDKQNQELEFAQIKLNERANQLELTNKFKSEFLANMSHELRTPLNSILILTKMLYSGDSGDLTEKQVKQIKTVHDAGSDLLKLINEVLDLAKVEAGQMQVYPEVIYLDSIYENLTNNFEPLAVSKGIEFRIKSEIQEESITSDLKLLQQVLRNLVANAVKFTRKGFVEIRFLPSEDSNEIKIEVQDTGIGIPKEQKHLVFEAFQQGDGSTNREFGGTGLGLSISREIVQLLKGKISLESEANQGSCFTLTLPKQLIQAEVLSNTHDSNSVIEEKLVLSNFPKENHADDSKNLQSADKVILLIEDDRRFALAIKEFSNQRGYKVLFAENGIDGIRMANLYIPTFIILDIQLPLIDGWQVLHTLKNNKKTKHIPINVFSVVDDLTQAYSMGALLSMTKPLSLEKLELALDRVEHFLEKPFKELLLIEDNKEAQHEISELIENNQVHVVTAESGELANQKLKINEYDCIILDLYLNSQISGHDVLSFLREEVEANYEHIHVPVIIYTAKDLSLEEEQELKKYSNHILLKSANSIEQLIENARLFIPEINPTIKTTIPVKNFDDNSKQQKENQELALSGKKVLLVEDDFRNAYSLSIALENKGLEIILAENGKEALSILDQANGQIDLILMDIMMPIMDGREAMRLIRQQPQYRELPIIALTAQAMKEDFQKNIQAGASDYLTKPIQVEELLKLMELWLVQ
ncbi:MAG: signal transduction histidine kinase/CheY-like chemotaxis protein [bacterium]|jgi:signal transduction histidine kinase/CheY-like chemotaxis protein